MRTIFCADRLVTDAGDFNGLNGAAPIGHNSGASAAAMAAAVPTLQPDPEAARAAFEAIVTENLQRGLKLTQRDVLINCIRDVRLKQRHRLVRAAVIEHMNAKSGIAFPGRRAQAERRCRPGERHQPRDDRQDQRGFGAE
jgi:hypothetical protein